MSKMRRNRMVAMLTLGATMLSGAAVTYANMTDVFSRSYHVYGTCNLNVTVRYTSIPGPWDRVYYSLALSGKAADKAKAETQNRVYVTRKSGKTVNLYGDLEIGSENQSFHSTETILDSEDITVRTSIDDKVYWCYAENPEK